MSSPWIAVIAVGVGTAVLKAVGPVGLASRDLPPRVADLLSLAGPAILAALVVTVTFGHARSLVLDARVAGVAAGAAAAMVRAPFGLVVLVGALATAGVRLVS